MARGRSASRKPPTSRCPAVPQPKQPRAERSKATNERLVVESLEEIAPGVLVVEEFELEADHDD
jgi:hypothetical protein